MQEKAMCSFLEILENLDISLHSLDQEATQQKLLKAYRIAIAERYNYLATAPTTPVIEIKRHKGYSGNSKVFYYIYHYSRDLNDNKDILTSTLTFPGTERKKAFEYFNNYVASHPGIITIQNTDKAKWER